ncbi:MAG: glycerol kinase GlpK [Alphaproteobacteria bacterium]|nr:glycerol kinase GlpK [Alphaproteobacteria bacterium]
MKDFVLAIDQGTTSSRAIVFDQTGGIRGMGQYEFAQHYPQSGWVEHEPEDIWQSVLAACRDALERAAVPAADIAAIGIANQRETVLLWDRITGQPVARAIVWQDRRTAPFCDKLRRKGHEKSFTRRTGLLVDPYFSGTKLRWLLDNVPGARARAERGELAFGTVDTFLIWRLTGGRVHATDATNASRTLMYNIATNDWDDTLLAVLGVPRVLLPEVKDCADDFGMTSPDILGAAIPIRGVAGDQQAATIGQACFAPGMMKATYGTGCFALINTGKKMVRSKNRLLTTIAYRLDGETTYALEGAIFVAGAAVQWLRDGLGIIGSAEQSGPLAEAADPSQSVYLVPAFVGLGAPWWDAEARAALFGMTRNTGPKELARAALESVAYQTADLLEAMRKDWRSDSETVLRVDGGMVASDWTMQFLADMLDAPVDRPAVLETTALGVAWLAGHRVGAWPGRDTFAANWLLDRQFTPQMGGKDRKKKFKGWRQAVKRVLS